jgi:hypothetical protein
MQEFSTCRTCLFYDEKDKYCREHFAAVCAVRVESNTEICSRYKDFNTLKWERWWLKKKCIDCFHFKKQKSDKNQDEIFCNHCLACKINNHFFHIDHENNACYLWTPKSDIVISSLLALKHRI